MSLLLRTGWIIWSIGIVCLFAATFASGELEMYLLGANMGCNVGSIISFVTVWFE